jgi:hypothetical protein
MHINWEKVNVGLNEEGDKLDSIQDELNENDDSTDINNVLVNLNLVEK